MDANEISERSQMIGSMAVGAAIFAVSLPMFAVNAPAQPFLRLLDFSTVILLMLPAVVWKWRLIRQIRENQPTINGFRYVQWGITHRSTDGDFLIFLSSLFFLGKAAISTMQIPERIVLFWLGLSCVALAFVSWRTIRKCPTYISPERRGFPVVPLAEDEHTNSDTETRVNE